MIGLGHDASAAARQRRFFSLVPVSSGLVSMVVQHLERHHPSVLAELLGEHTQMPVRQAEDHACAQPNHVYILPPNSELTLTQGELRVARSTGEGLRTPIDAFFRSLTRDQGERAIGIVLSGAGSDGTAGLRVINEHGGVTLAQSPESAKYDSMPQSAITAGVVDFALPIDEMPDWILAHARRIGDVQRQTWPTSTSRSLRCSARSRRLSSDRRGTTSVITKPGTLLRGSGVGFSSSRRRPSRTTSSSSSATRRR